MLKNEIEIPEGLEAGFENGRLTVKGSKGEISRGFRHPNVKLKIENSRIILQSDMERKKTKAIMGTWNAHINNMFTGVSKGWSGELKLVYSHFPVKMKTEDKKLLIENFLGERSPREVPVPEDLEVKVDKNTIIVSGTDKERVGQLCARIEEITKVRGYDRRVFQDGIYITRKPYSEEEDEGKEGTDEPQEEDKKEEA